MVKDTDLARKSAKGCSFIMDFRSHLQDRVNHRHYSSVTATSASDHRYSERMDFMKMQHFDDHPDFLHSQIRSRSSLTNHLYRFSAGYWCGYFRWLRLYWQQRLEVVKSTFHLDDWYGYHLETAFEKSNLKFGENDSAQYSEWSYLSFQSDELLHYYWPDQIKALRYNLHSFNHEVKVSFSRRNSGACYLCEQQLDLFPLP